MPVTDIPGLATRGCVVEIFEPAVTHLDADIVIDRFELGAGETRKDYTVPSRNTSMRIRDESLEELNEQFPIGAPAPAPEEAQILPHAAAEQEAGRARLQELGPAYEAIDQYNAEQGIETPAERAAKWQEDVDSIKGKDLPEPESYRILLAGRHSITERDGVMLEDEDYEGSEGSSKGTKQAGRTRNADKTKPKQLEHQAKAEEARKKAQEQRRQESHQ